MTIRAAWTAALFLSIATRSGIASDAETQLSLASLLTVSHPHAVEISPDGAWVAYTVVRTRLAQNSYGVDLYVVSTNCNRHPRLLREARWNGAAPYGFPALTWTPDSAALLYVAAAQEGQQALYRLSLADGREDLIAYDDNLPQGAHFPTQKFTFSPDGESLAFVAGVSPGPPDTSFKTSLAPAQADARWMPESATGGRKVVVVLDLDQRLFRVLTGPQLSVVSFWDSGVAWSPDGGRIAFAAAEAAYGTDHTQAAMNSDIYVVDAKGRVEPGRVVHLPGCDRDPAWSPDGETLAFVSQEGVEGYFFGNTLATISARGGEPSFPGRGLRALSGGPLWNLQWAGYGEAIYVQGFYRFTHQLFRVPLSSSPSESIAAILPGAWFYGQVSYSRDRSHIAFSAENAVTPPEVHLTRLGKIKPRALTHLNAQWDASAGPAVQQVRWRSSDDRWDLHGLLLLPRAAGRQRKLPLLTTIMGGPTMVTNRFNLSDAHYPLIALATRDYAVFLPNTRGREGYGEDLASAIKSEESYVLNPAADVLSGIDHLVAQGIADESRLSVAGFSYGGTLVAYLLTGTTRFKAAVYGGGSPDLLLGNFARLDLSWRLPLLRDLRGTRDPFDRATIERDFAQTALFRLDRLSTPVLIESGAGLDGADAETDRVFFIGLQHFGIPSEWLVYPRSGHGWSEPLLRLESYERVRSWLDYWVLDRRYRDPTMQRRYDEWKSARAIDHKISFGHLIGGSVDDN